MNTYATSTTKRYTTPTTPSESCLTTPISGNEHTPSGASH
jgi:hypothetical protein